MKKLVIVLLILVPSLTFGQIVDHFSNSDSQWNLADTYPNANQQNPNFVETRTTFFGFIGDTVMNGDTWLKMYSTNDSLFSSNLNFEVFIHSSSNFVLKTDSNLLIDTLYNFNISVGDSVFFDFGFYSENIPVSNIDSVLINNQYYKRFHFAEPTGTNAFTNLNEIWIEGIGSLNGPLFPRQPELFSTEIPDSLTLICTNSNGNSVWQHPNYTNCIVNIVLGIENPKQLNFSVYPNPFQNKITISSSNSESKELTIYNGLGQKVLVDSWANNFKEINLRNLKNGLYLLNIRENDKSQIIKLVKSN